MRSRIGIITNPESHRNKTGYADIRDAVAGDPDVVHAEIGSIADVAAALKDFAARDVGIVVPNGGDGTVIAALTEIFEHRPFSKPPLIGVLPRGLTNMIAADVGLGGRSDAALRRLISLNRDGSVQRHVLTRHLIRMEGAAGVPPQVGLFFGSAGLTRAILACRETIARTGLSPAAAAALMIGRVLIGKPASASNDGAIFRGDGIALTSDGTAEPETQYLLLLVTTLERMILRSRPFWGDGDGHLRFTAVRHPPRRLLRAILPLLYGGKGRRLPNDDYVSRRASRIEIRMDCPFTLDGQMFDPDPDRPVVLTDEYQASFVRA